MMRAEGIGGKNGGKMDDEGGRNWREGGQRNG